MIVFDRIRSGSEQGMTVGSRALLIGDGLEAGPAAALPETSITTADTLLRGVWQSGQAEFDVILVKLHDEGRTAAALGSLREVSPLARILLVCDPHQEPLARRLAAAGADDYVVAPLVEDDLRVPRRDARNQTVAPAPREKQLELLNAALALIGRGPQPLLDALAQLVACVFQTCSVAIELDDCRFDGLDDADAVLEHAIVAGGRVRGRIRLGRALDGPYPTDVIDRLEPYAVLVATVFDQDRQSRGWIDLALRDELTGLLNRRGFDVELDRLVATAAADHRRLTLCRFDIADFKAFNEQHGRDAGDRLLRELATLLLHCTRKGDRVARSADDEFAVLLVDDGVRRRADSEHPRTLDALAGRIEAAAADHAFELLGAGAARPVSLAAGIASYPWQASDAASLFGRAAPEVGPAARNSIRIAGA